MSQRPLLVDAVPLGSLREDYYTIATFDAAGDLISDHIVKSTPASILFAYYETVRGGRRLVVSHTTGYPYRFYDLFEITKDGFRMLASEETIETLSMKRRA